MSFELSIDSLSKANFVLGCVFLGIATHVIGDGIWNLSKSFKLFILLIVVEAQIVLIAKFGCTCNCHPRNRQNQEQKVKKPPSETSSKEAEVLTYRSTRKTV